jgi:hypothetical protein
MESSIINLDVGGIKLKVYRSTLTQLEYFKSKLERWSNNQDELFVDYDYNLFIHLINKLRDPTYNMPRNKNINMMCDYFGFNYIKKCTIIKHETFYSGSNMNVIFHKIPSKSRLIKIILCADHSSYVDKITFKKGNKVILKIKKDYKDIYLTKEDIYFTKEDVYANFYVLRQEFINVLQKINNLTIEVSSKLTLTCIIIKKRS